MKKTSSLFNNIGIRIFLMSIFLPGFFLLQAQCFKGNTAVGPGEYLAYDVSYQVGPVWTNIALVTFTTAKEVNNGKNVLHFKLSAKTYPTYDHIFKVRDYYESWVNVETFRPVRFQRYTVHKANTILSSQLFPDGSSSVFSTYRLNTNPASSETFTVGACVFDMVTAMYFARNLNLDYLRDGTAVPVSALYGSEAYQVNLVAAGREIIEARDGKKYHCMKFRIRMPSGLKIFKENSEVNLWVTADKNRIPVYMEAEIFLGKVKIYLNDAKGMLNPMTALLSK